MKAPWRPNGPATPTPWRAWPTAPTAGCWRPAATTTPSGCGTPTRGAARATADLDTQVKALCFSPDGRRLYTGNGNGSCYELDVPGLLADGR